MGFYTILAYCGKREPQSQAFIDRKESSKPQTYSHAGAAVAHSSHQGRLANITRHPTSALPLMRISNTQELQFVKYIKVYGRDKTIPTQMLFMDFPHHSLFFLKSTFLLMNHNVCVENGVHNFQTYATSINEPPELHIGPTTVGAHGESGVFFLYDC